MRTHEPRTWSRDDDDGRPWYKDWRAFAAAMCVSCVGVFVRHFSSFAPTILLNPSQIKVRSVYRSVEFSQGYGGYLSTTEVFFWVLDFVPLLVALLVYIPFWPGRFINPLETIPARTVQSDGDAHRRTNEDVPLKGWNSQVEVN